MRPSIITIFNQKGGVGKTTTAINLSAYLAKAGKTVLLIDLDAQGNATSGVGLDKDGQQLTSYDVLLNPGNLVNTITHTATENLFILPANDSLSAIDLELANVPNRESRLKSILASTVYDFIIIDCPPSLGILTVNALVAAKEVLIPVQAEYYALEGLSQLLNIVQRVKANLNPDLELLGVLLTMYDKRTALAEQVRQELEKHLSDKLLETVIPRNVRLAEAPSYGRTIVEHDKWSKGARAYKQLAKEVMDRAHN